jgi:hypothetical protein
MAVIGLLVAGFPLAGLPFAVVALVLGIISRKSPLRWLAWAGIALGIVGLCWSLLTLLVAISDTASQRDGTLYATVGPAQDN